MHRERVIDALWPDVDLDAALPRLHKAAQYARRRSPRQPGDAVVLKGEPVALFPGVPVEVDVAAFEAAAAAALDRAAPSVEACTAAIARYGGELLPRTSTSLGRRNPEAPAAGAVGAAAARRPPVAGSASPRSGGRGGARRAVARSGGRGRPGRGPAPVRRAGHQPPQGLGVEPGPEAVALRERVLAVPERRSDRPRISETLVERDDELTVLLRAAHAVTRTAAGRRRAGHRRGRQRASRR